MKSRSRNLIMMALTVGMLLCNPSIQFGCGPFSERAVFTFNVHPEFPLEKYAAGELGVLQPGFARSYLTVAYRYFTGIGLDQQEQKAVAALWKHRLNEGDDNDAEKSVKTWLDARGKIAGLPTLGELDPNRNISTSNYYFNYLNCNPDSFQTAVTTLDRLTKQFGAASPQLKDWLQAQDQVFANCAGGPSIPAEAASNLPAAIKAERTYQIAAANFYAGKFDDAQRIFEQIGNDKSSPWRATAPYMAARTLIRKATLTGVDNQIDKPTLALAGNKLQAIAADPNQKSIQPAARRLMSYVRFRLNPEERLHELAQSVIQKNSGQTLNQDLYDYTALIDKYVTDNDSAPTFEHLPAVGRNDDVTDWVLMFQVMDQPAADYSIRKYEEKSSLPWLVAAISKIDGTNPKAATLIGAAGKVNSSSPAYSTVEYHRLRLMIESRKKDDARKELDQVLGAAKLIPSARNDFLSLRLKVATSLDEFLKFAQRNATALTFDEDGRELPEDLNEKIDNQPPKSTVIAKTMFDEDSTKVFNEQMPLSVLKDAATNKSLPDHLRRQLVIETWVRATLLDKDDIAKSLIPELEELVPEFKETIAGYALDTTPQARKFTALYMMLKFPGTRPEVGSGLARQTELEKIDDYRDNWWCAYGKKPEPTTTDDTEKKNQLKTPRMESPDFLTAAQKTAAAAEWKKLTALDTAPNYLCAEAIKWATAQPNDARVPEALHLAVRATRYGCTNAGTGKLSKAAYDLLHKKYPNSEWAAKTKYWFKD